MPSSELRPAKLVPNHQATCCASGKKKPRRTRLILQACHYAHLHAALQSERDVRDVRADAAASAAAEVFAAFASTESQSLPLFSPLSPLSEGRRIAPANKNKWANIFSLFLFYFCPPPPLVESGWGRGVLLKWCRLLLRLHRFSPSVNQQAAVWDGEAWRQAAGRRRIQIPSPPTSPLLFLIFGHHYRVLTSWLQRLGDIIEELADIVRSGRFLDCFSKRRVYMCIIYQPVTQSHNTFITINNDGECVFTAVIIS